MSRLTSDNPTQKKLLSITLAAALIMLSIPATSIMNVTQASADVEIS